MKLTRHLRLLALTLAVCMAGLVAQSARPAEPQTESDHRHGPAGLEGWTLNYPFPDRPEERYPRVLVIARQGKIIHRFRGHSYVWKWIFWANGQQVAYEDGPPHFVLRCVLAEVATGKELENYDCFTGIPEHAPDWLRTLENAQ